MKTHTYYDQKQDRMVTVRDLSGSVEFDKEMDRKEYTTRAEELEQLEHEKLTSSPAVNVEFALEQYERNLAASRAQRWDGQERWQGRENEEMRIVNILHPHQWIRKLQRAGVDARIEWARSARVWLNPWVKLGRIGVNARVEMDGKLEERTISTLQYPYGPEYSLMRFNEYNVPTNERYRGWRTPLLELIRLQVITEDEALKAFGPALGAAADFYLRHLQVYRMARMGLRV